MGQQELDKMDKAHSSVVRTFESRAKKSGPRAEAKQAFVARLGIAMDQHNDLRSVLEEALEAASSLPSIRVVNRENIQYQSDLKKLDEAISDGTLQDLNVKSFQTGFMKELIEPIQQYVSAYSMHTQEFKASKRVDVDLEKEWADAAEIDKAIEELRELTVLLKNPEDDKELATNLMAARTKIARLIELEIEPENVPGLVDWIQALKPPPESEYANPQDTFGQVKPDELPEPMAEQDLASIAEYRRRREEAKQMSASAQRPPPHGDQPEDDLYHEPQTGWNGDGSSRVVPDEHIYSSAAEMWAMLNGEPAPGPAPGEVVYQSVPTSSDLPVGPSDPGPVYAVPDKTGLTVAAAAQEKGTEQQKKPADPNGTQPTGTKKREQMPLPGERPRHPQAFAPQQALQTQQAGTLTFPSLADLSVGSSRRPGLGRLQKLFDKENCPADLKSILHSLATYIIQPENQSQLLAKILKDSESLTPGHSAAVGEFIGAIQQKVTDAETGKVHKTGFNQGNIAKLCTELEKPPLPPPRVPPRITK